MRNEKKTGQQSDKNSVSKCWSQKNKPAALFPFPPPPFANLRKGIDFSPRSTPHAIRGTNSDTQ